MHPSSPLLALRGDKLVETKAGRLFAKFSFFRAWEKQMESLKISPLPGANRRVLLRNPNKRQVTKDRAQVASSVLENPPPHATLTPPWFLSLTPGETTARQLPAPKKARTSPAALFPGASASSSSVVSSLSSPIHCHPNSSAQPYSD